MIYLIYRCIIAALSLSVYPVYVFLLLLRFLWDFEWLGFNFVNDMYTKHYDRQYDSIWDYIRDRKNGNPPDTRWMNN